MSELDPRIVKVSFEVNGELKIYENLAITANGQKFANPLQNECDIKISNLDQFTRNFLLSETSPFNSNRTPKKIIVEAGRVSYGTVKIFEGDIVMASPSQPPDITISIKALTANYKKGEVIARTQASKVALSKLSQQIADDLGVSLNYQAKEKIIANYAYSGNALGQVNKLGETGAVNVYIDDNVLVVKDYNVPLTGRTRILNLSNGMIGIPEVTEQGVRVKFLLDNQTTLGSGLEITSELYPAVNGVYAIYKLDFEIASRDTQFYYIAEAKRLNNG